MLERSQNTTHMSVPPIYDSCRSGLFARQVIRNKVLSVWLFRHYGDARFGLVVLFPRTIRFLLPTPLPPRLLPTFSLFHLPTSIPPSFTVSNPNTPHPTPLNLASKHIHTAYIQHTPHVSNPGFKARDTNESPHAMAVPAEYPSSSSLRSAKPRSRSMMYRSARVFSLSFLLNLERCWWVSEGRRKAGGGRLRMVRYKSTCSECGDVVCRVLVDGDVFQGRVMLLLLLLLLVLIPLALLPLLFLNTHPN